MYSKVHSVYDAKSMVFGRYYKYDNIYIYIYTSWVSKPTSITGFPRLKVYFFSTSWL